MFQSLKKSFFFFVPLFFLQTIVTFIIILSSQGNKYRMRKIYLDADLTRTEIIYGSAPYYHPIYHFYTLFSPLFLLLLCFEDIHTSVEWSYVCRSHHEHLWSNKRWRKNFIKNVSTPSTHNKWVTLVKRLFYRRLTRTRKNLFLNKPVLWMFISSHLSYYQHFHKDETKGSEEERKKKNLDDCFCLRLCFLLWRNIFHNFYLALSVVVS